MTEQLDRHGPAGTGFPAHGFSFHHDFSGRPPMTRHDTRRSGPLAISPRCRPTPPARTTAVDACWYFQLTAVGLALSVASRDLPPTSPLFWPSALLPLTLTRRPRVALRSGTLHPSLLDGVGGSSAVLLVASGPFLAAAAFVESRALRWCGSSSGVRPRFDHDSTGCRSRIR